MSDTIPERLARLTPYQRATLEALKAAKRVHDDAPDAYARAINRCTKQGITYGMMAYELGIHRVSIFQHEKRFIRRVEK